MLYGEPLSGSAEPCHDLVGDEHHAVLVAQLAHPGHIAGWGHHDARGAGHRLEDDRRERRRPLVLDQPVEVVEGALGLLLLVLGVKRGAVQERSVEVDDAAARIVIGVAARITGQVDRGVGAPVVRAVTGQHLVAAGVQAGHADGVLDGVCAAVGEEHPVQVARGALGDQPGRLGPGRVDVLRGDGAQLGGLLGNGRNDFRVLMTDVGEDQLRREVEQLVACAVPDVLPVGGDDRHRLDLRLRRPRVEDVLAVELVGVGAFGDRGLDVLAVG